MDFVDARLNGFYCKQNDQISKREKVIEIRI